MPRILRLVMPVLFAMIFVASPSFAIGDPTSPQTRATQWERRNSPQAVEALSKEFLDLLVLDPFELQVSHLRFRPGLVQVSDLWKEKKYADALDAFERYYFDKLRYPTRFGLSEDSVSPYAAGVCGVGMWPSAVFTPQPAANVLATADALKQGRMKLGGKVVELGPPGQVNWNLSPMKPDTPKREWAPFPALYNATGFYPLVQAYLLSGDESYLVKWAEYMDDWAMNSTYADSVHPCFVPSGGLGVATAIQTVRLLAGVARVLPAGHNPIPATTLARVLRKLLREYTLPSIVYLRSNTHNWTPSAHMLLAALLFDEFKAAPELWRESRRRNIEDNAVTQNLRDGAENQQDPWYNINYLQVCDALRLLDARSSLEPWKELPWVAELQDNLLWRRELQEHVDARANYFIHLRTPQNEWPIGIRGGDKRPATGIPGSFEYGNLYALAPDSYARPENARIVAAITDPASGVRPTYTSEWFPYAGYNIVREGWEKDSGYGFLFCSPHPGAYGGYRSRSNNNFFGLAAFGQDLLVSDAVGHYMYPDSPIRVDGKQQFFHAGYYLVGPPSAHKVYLVKAWTEPAAWRWDASKRFNLMEGIYAGPYADVPNGGSRLALPLDQTLRGVTHQRLVQYVRGAGLWIVTDRMTAAGQHNYDQVWRLPLKPCQSKEVPAFEEADVHIDAAQRRIFTTSNGTTSVRGKPVQQANVSLYQFSSLPLDYTGRTVPNNLKNRYQMYGWKEIHVKWRGVGATQIVTVVFPRKPGADAAWDLLNIKPLTGDGDVEGFAADTPDGTHVQYVASAGKLGTLRLGPVTARGESLLLVTKPPAAAAGMVLVLQPYFV